MAQLKDKTKVAQGSEGIRARPALERKQFERELNILQMEHVKLQDWVKYKVCLLKTWSADWRAFGFEESRGVTRRTSHPY